MQTVEVIPEFLVDAPEQIADLLRRMWPIDWALLPGGRARRAGRDDPYRDARHVLAVLMARAGRRSSPRTNTSRRTPGSTYLAKLVLVSSRSVNSLVWALLFVAIFGPGALAGTLAIAFRSIGFVGKLLSARRSRRRNTGPIEALQPPGRPGSRVVLKGYWPQVKPAFWSIALFRWDINVRESAVLGLVGAGGIGMALDTALNLFQWDRVAMILVAIFAVVILAEIVVTGIRRRIL